MELNKEKISIINSKGNRYYLIPGLSEPLPSVTSVLNTISKPGLISWEKNVAIDYAREKISKYISNTENTNLDGLHEIFENAKEQPKFIMSKAGEFGTKAHEFIELLLQQNFDVDVPSNMKWIYKNFNDWKNEYNFNNIEQEKYLYSTKYGYAGTADSIGLINDNLFILDWKTSKGLYIEHLLQVSAYANAYTELTGNQIANAGVLRLDKNQSGYEFKIIDDINKHFITFRAVLWLWRFLNDPDSSYTK
tara:strand:- start:13066 stop:13812 length:747 start_codon:yes stop_codon:yes gene_type:complete